MKTNSKKPKMRMQAQEIPVNKDPSNANGDRLSVALCVALIILAAGSLGGGIYFGTTGLIASYKHVPIEWWGVMNSLVLVVVGVLVARALAWLSVFGPVILGTRMGSWKSMEAFASKGMPLAKLYPGGTSWLATALVQSLVNRGQYEEALATAEAEWTRSGQDEKHVQNLGGLCFAAGIANQAQSEPKKAQMWNERAIAVLNKSVEQLEKPQKGLMAKLATTQAQQAMGQLRMQLAAAYCNNGTIYMASMDYRKAKENYRAAVDNAIKAPDFPQKAEVVKFSNEQLARLKHA